MKRSIPRARVASIRSDFVDWLDDHWKKLAVLFGAVGVVFGLYAGIRWARHSEYRQGKVDRLIWKHRTNLRERCEYRDGDWGNPPTRAGYYREPTWGHDCYDKWSGSYCCAFGAKGMCTMWCDDYDRWCNYSYYDWPIKTFKEITGTGEQTSWETFGPRLDDNHRETVEGWYSIYFTNTEKLWKYDTRDYDSFLKFHVGELWELEFPNIGSMHPTKKTVLEAP